MRFSLRGWLYNHDDVAITYSGNWTQVEKSLPVGDGSSGMAVEQMISLRRTDQLGDWAELKFNGTGVRMRGVDGWDHGFVTVTLDGQEVVLDTSTYAYASGDAIDQVGYPSFIDNSQFHRHGLSDQEHTIRITNSVAGVNGSALEFGAFEVSPYDPVALKNCASVMLIFFVLCFAVIISFVRRLFFTAAKQAVSQAQDYFSEKISQSFITAYDHCDDEHQLFQRLVEAGLISQPELDLVEEEQVEMTEDEKNNEREMIKRLEQAGFL